MELTKQTQREQVLRKVRQASELPALAETVNVVNKFKSSEDSTVADLANILLKDYALTTRVLKVVNSAHYMQSGEVTTVSRAIFLMGVDYIKQIALTLMLFDTMQGKGGKTEIMDAITQAFCGGVLARKVAKDLEDVEEEEAFICTLLHPLGKIVTAHAMPEKVAEIRKMSAEQGISEEQASLAVLGISYEELGATIAAEWNYPRKIVQAMRHVTAPGSAQQQAENGKLCMIASLATDMSNVLASDKDREDKIEAFKALLAPYNEQIKVKPGAVAGLVNTAVADFTKLAAILNLDLKKSRFSRQLDKWSKTPESAAREAVQDKMVMSFKTDALRTVDTLFALEEENAENIFAKGVQDINNFMMGHYTLNDVIHIALETMYRALKSAKVVRVLFFVRNIKLPRLEIRIGFGSNVHEAREWFVIDVTESRDVFQMAVSQNKDLVIRDTDASEIQKFIPGWYEANRKAPSYLLLFPISVNSRNIGLITIEGDEQGFATFTNAHLSYIKILRDQIVMATRPPSQPAGK